MKGRKHHASGGKIRDIGGIKAPEYGSEPNVMKAAEGKTTGIVDMDGPGGGPARKRLDRPGRKHGGKVEHHEKHEAKGGFLANLKKGALRESLHVKEGEKIPAKKLEKAAHSDNPVLKKRAVLAENMRHFKH